MSLPPARLRAASGLALTVAVLLTTSGCLTGESGRAAAAASTRPPAEPPAPTGTSALTAAQAQAALITVADLGVPWMQTQGAATWRDGMLKAETDEPDCQRLLEALYTDELLGDATGMHAVTALDDGDEGAQLRYQVATRGPADVERTLSWLNGLPETCGEFTASTTAAGSQDVQVSAIDLPQVGDARQGLRITLTGEAATDSESEDESEDAESTTLTLDVAAVRVGEDTIVLSNGSLGDVSADATSQALELGAQRLTQVRKDGRLQA
ncbi:hypothetical protein ACJ6WF_21725 [Streptomyces sp. MMS24-I2-30]|uniref:hypothetical protein n=1 Tax=Streptomyces sp. MMS24-I2-30 TaxID=3351564 RepID=UPI003896C063